MRKKTFSSRVANMAVSTTNRRTWSTVLKSCYRNPHLSICWIASYPEAVPPHRSERRRRRRRHLRHLWLRRHRERRGILAPGGSDNAASFICPAGFITAQTNSRWPIAQDPRPKSLPCPSPLQKPTIFRVCILAILAEENALTNLSQRELLEEKNTVVVPTKDGLEVFVTPNCRQWYCRLNHYTAVISRKKQPQWPHTGTSSISGVQQPVEVRRTYHSWGRRESPRYWWWSLDSCFCLVFVHVFLHVFIHILFKSLFCWYKSQQSRNSIHMHTCIQRRNLSDFKLSELHASRVSQLQSSPQVKRQRRLMRPSHQRAMLGLFEAQPFVLCKMEYKNNQKHEKYNLFVDHGTLGSLLSLTLLPEAHSVSKILTVFWSDFL